MRSNSGGPYPVGVKLQFSSRDEVSLLVVTGPVTVHDTAILKAGITKIFAGGKRKIVLSLGLCEIAGEDVLKELSSLEAMASSQGAAVAFGGIGPDLKRVVEKVSPGMAALCFTSDDEAITSVQGTQLLDGAAAEMAALRKELEAKTRELADLKAKFAAGDSEETLKTRIQVADLVAKNRYLEEQLRMLTLERRIPPDAEAVKEKIAGLEAAIEALKPKAPAKAPAGG